jgi:hypothetical protein
MSLLVIMAVALLTRHDWAPSLHNRIMPRSSASTGTRKTTAAACPRDIAEQIPGRSTLISQYQTSEYEVTLCRTTRGAIYYHGVEKGNPALQITLPATQISGSYKASNHGYTYWVTKHDLIVTEQGRTLMRETLAPLK